MGDFAARASFIYTQATPERAHCTGIAANGSAALFFEMIPSLADSRQEHALVAGHKTGF
jgi:hypothetical protein